MIKLIAIDLDGTLYNSERLITPRCREALAVAVKSGILPVIVTGRGRRGAETALELLGMDFPYICSAGALLRSGINGEDIHTWTFHHHSELLPVIDFARASKDVGLFAEIPTGGMIWFGPDSMGEFMDPLTLKEAYRSIRTMQPETDFDRPILKMTVSGREDRLREAAELIRHACPSIHQVVSGIQYIDLTANGVNKGSALAALTSRLGLRPDEVAAVGDQHIDYQMLLFAGLPVAMGNAVPELKEIATWVAPNNDEDGVAWMIEKILLSELQERT